MKSVSLTLEEREFLELISQAVFANPFSDDRTEVDLLISGVPRNTSPSERLQATHARVSAFITRLAQAGKSDVNDFTDRDRHILVNAHLFDIFHNFIDRIDKLIQHQIRTGDASCPVVFGSDVLEQLVNRGFSRADALRYFAMFYQLRRAYYFIHCSLAGRSKSMKQLRLSLWNNVFTYDTRLYDQHLWNRMEDFSTLLLGGTGTGKGAAAMAIGRSGFIPYKEKQSCFSQSFMRSFLDINLSQFPETLIESELFGHRKGAFTGATENHEGIFSRCSAHGSIFLDEIGDVSVPVQIKLLKVLQEREYSPVGSHDKCRFQGRVIAASNKSIDELRKKNLFRDDFFYRLCSDIIVVPPLSQRLQEDPDELDDMLGVTIQRIIGQESKELVEMVRKTIEKDLGNDYGWPGNVRELEQCVRRILISKSYRGDRQACEHDLKSHIIHAIENGTYVAQELIADYCALLYRRHGTYEEVARRTGLDRRTVKKHVIHSSPEPE